MRSIAILRQLSMFAACVGSPVRARGSVCTRKPVDKLGGFEKRRARVHYRLMALLQVHKLGAGFIYVGAAI